MAASPALASNRDKTDIVTLRNGDRITGEIIGLEYGLLQVKTSSMGTVNIEWPDVRSVESGYTFYIEDNLGRRHYGTLTTLAGDGELVVSDPRDPARIALPAVVRLSQIESGFWDRIHGTIALGYTYTKSSDISLGNFALNADFRSQTMESTLVVTANTTKSVDTGTVDRDQISSTVRWLRPDRNFWVLLSSLERNEELGIDARVQLGGAFGHHFIQSQSSELTGFAGFSFNQEWATGNQGSRQSVEGVLGAAWRIYRFGTPETRLTSSVNLYPSLTESGRYRGDLSVTLSRDLTENLTLDLNLYGNYDSAPPDPTREKSDYGVTTSLGYKF